MRCPRPGRGREYQQWGAGSGGGRAGDGGWLHGLRRSAAPAASVCVCVYAGGVEGGRDDAEDFIKTKS